jgi:hypothetical protein
LYRLLHARRFVDGQDCGAHATNERGLRDPFRDPELSCTVDAGLELASLHALCQPQFGHEHARSVRHQRLDWEQAICEHNLMQKAALHLACGTVKTHHVTFRTCNTAVEQLPKRAAWLRAAGAHRSEHCPALTGPWRRMVGLQIVTPCIGVKMVSSLTDGSLLMTNCRVRMPPCTSRAMPPRSQACT